MALLLDAIPEDIAELRSRLEAALDKRNALVGRDADLAKAEPAQVAAIATTRTALEEADADFALATDEDEKALRVTRDRRRRELADAEEALRQTQNARRGIVSRLAEADAVIEEAYGPFREIMHQFDEEVCAAYRELLLQACAPLARVLRLGYALHGAVPFAGTLRHALAAANVSDIGPRPGRPVARFIEGERVWLTEEDGVAGGTLRDFSADPEMVALHRLLRPLAATYEAATVRIRRIEVERDRLGISASPAPQVSVEPPQISQEEWLAQQPSLEEHRAEMKARRAIPAGITSPVPLINPTTDRFGDTQLA
jgi:hypothetical protein